MARSLKMTQEDCLEIFQGDVEKFHQMSREVIRYLGTFAG